MLCIIKLVYFAYCYSIQCNKLMKLDDTMLMYGIYNVETLEKLIKTVHEIHNTTSSHEKLFVGEHNHSLDVDFSYC